MKSFDAIVIGLGGMGGAALYHLASRGAHVLGIEQFAIAHDQGSSHGETRIIRKSYFEHPDYVPLLHRAYDLWADLESTTGSPLVHRTGLILFGPPQGPVIAGVTRSAEAHALDIERLTVHEATQRYPVFHPSEDMVAIYERDAGYLAVEACVRAHIEAAVHCGANLALGQTVLSWSADDTSTTVTTSEQTYAADSLIFCVGPWTSSLLPAYSPFLEILRKPVFWFPAPDPMCYDASNFPVFGFDTPRGFFYGFPSLDAKSIKVGCHTDGTTVATPSAIDRTLHPDDVAATLRFLGTHLPLVGDSVIRYGVCMYTMTPDGHFLVGAHPALANVYVAAGFSGHGFKFAPVVGKALADIALDRVTHSPVAFLSPSRFPIKA